MSYYVNIEMPFEKNCESILYGPFSTSDDAHYWANRDEKLMSSKWQWHVSKIMSSWSDVHKQIDK
jgi:L-rhamnose mutarotase